MIYAVILGLVVGLAIYLLSRAYDRRVERKVSVPEGRRSEPETYHRLFVIAGNMIEAEQYWQHYYPEIPRRDFNYLSINPARSLAGIEFQPTDIILICGTAMARPDFSEIMEQVHARLGRTHPSQWPEQVQYTTF